MDIFTLWILLVISHSPWTLIPNSSHFFALHWSAIDLDELLTMLCYSTHLFGKVLCPFHSHCFSLQQFLLSMELF